jgi:hypothetical protein
MSFDEITTFSFTLFWMYFITQTLLHGQLHAFEPLLRSKKITLGGRASTACSQWQRKNV